ncbi:3-oxoacyl-ACP synthase [Rhizobium leguminosarum bv. trifolii]|uniref:3-oxoacyl-ACP synthase n=1 Tax=Rhizobium leguminosarum bv. trifolii TaxID=386 RepID=A0A1B8R3W9_RHILT|nr:3-oxoacyl-ACP synthase [Rhizobium leguminosarum]AOO93886.1 3-oxoacyl-ACP synthase [Rhizobium leguminosarum bv. trifolii]OBY03507.1 3-oxoacyl-ACP synthase [Rhizobium leguminosarum bv. trifolii]
MSAMLDIVSIGMVTAVGLDASSSCAAMRAKLDGFQETQFVGSSSEWVVGAPVPLPHNWIGEERMARMAAAAISESLAQAPGAREQAVLLLCLAEESRPGRPYGKGSALLDRIAAIINFEPRAGSQIVAHGRPSGHVALNLARKILASNQERFVVIAGIDSYLTKAAISEYLSAERLLTPDNPNGFIPGEAAAAVLCCKAGSNPFQLLGLGLTHERAPIYNSSDLPMRGDGMTDAYRLALEETEIDMNNIGYRISDLIGEQYWFKQSALASLRLLRGRHEFQDLWSPAESLGNIGAAVVPVMLGMAWMAARKGYAASNPVLIEASSDAGICGAAVFAAGATR